MKNLSASLFVFIALSCPLSADTDEGVRLYNAEDFSAAFLEFLPNANNGISQAQYYLGQSFYFGHGVDVNYTKAMKWYRLAADQGDAKAQRQIGRLYDLGDGVAVDYAEAMKWYRLAADQGDAEAQRSIGTLYYFGDGVAVDYAEAMKWYRLAADQGDAVAQRRIGSLYDFGRGVAVDYAEAMKWYRLAADQGDAVAQRRIGSLYYFGDGVAVDYAEAMKWYRLAADQGDAVAQRRIGSLYYFGDGVAVNYKEAMKWYRIAADQGDAGAQRRIGVLYDLGRGVAVDYAEAMKWYRLAADQGDAVAQQLIGVLYDLGRGVAVDYAEAMKWYRLAADQGYAVAQRRIGSLYDLGRGVAVDYAEAMKWYRLAADQGYAVAQRRIGSLYYFGDGVAVNYKEAMKWYRIAADQGDAVAQRRIGVLYYFGDGVAVNYKEAMKWYRIAADQGDAEAQRSIGTLYDFGDGVAVNYKEAMKWYRIAADQGDAEAQRRIGTLYYFGDGVAVDYAEAMKWYRLAADQGDAEAQRRIGVLYDLGRGVAVDYAEAMKWYRLAADQGDAEAQWRIGVLYDLGDGVAVDYAEAMKWYRLAADQGDAVAQRRIGSLYYFGDGVAVNYKEAMKWYRIAADQGDAEAQRRIGTLYDFGDGVAVNYKEAMKWYRIAADQGDAEAQRRIGVLYDLGDGVAVDYAEAMKWYRLAADQGDAVAQRRIGVLYDFGDGVAVDYKEAMKWYRIAADQGDAEAQWRIGKLYEFGHGVSEDTDEAENWYKLSAESGSELSVGFLGQTYIKNGRISKARNLIIRALGPETSDDKKSENSFKRAKNLFLLAELHKSTGSLENMIAVYDNLLTDTHFLSKSNDPRFLDLFSRAAWNLIYMLEPIKAEQVITVGASHFLKNPEKYPYEMSVYYNAMGGIALLNEKYKQAEAYFLKVKDLEAEASIEIPSYLLFGLGSTYMRLAEYPKSIDYLEKGIKDHRFGGNIDEYKEVYVPLALSYFYSEDYNNSLRVIRDLSGLVSKNMQRQNVSVMPVVNNFNQEAFSLHVAIALHPEQDGDRVPLIDEAFKTAQLGQSTNAANATAQMAARFASKSDAIGQLIRRQQDLVVQYKTANDALIQSIDPNIKDTPNNNPASLKEDVDAIEATLDLFNLELLKAFPRYADLVENQPLSLSELQDLLISDEGLFTLIYNEETKSYYTFFVGKNAIKSYRINITKEKLTSIVAQLRSGIDLSNSFGFGDLPNFDMDLSHDLYSKLFGPVEDMLEGIQHLLVVPTGPLESLPLNLLITEKPKMDPKASAFDNYQAAAWLPKSYSLTRLPSVSSLRALRVFSSEGQSQDPFIGFGDPVLDGPAGDLRGLTVEDVYQGGEANIAAVRNLPELPETSEELKRIAAYLGAPEDKIYLRERASETVLKNTNLTNSRVVAFATHGLVGGEISGLAEPALVLSPPSEATDEDDGLLKASEVAQLKMNADMVLLSACNTASGDELGAEGLSGLARAFIYAGARSLLVSHWSVESTSAAELTTGMFDAINQDQEIGRSEALQRSIIELMTNEDRPYYSHPAFWAPFSLIGDGQTAQLN